MIVDINVLKIFETDSPFILLRNYLNTEEHSISIILNSKNDEIVQVSKDNFIENFTATYYVDSGCLDSLSLKEEIIDHAKVMKSHHELVMNVLIRSNNTLYMARKDESFRETPFKVTEDHVIYHPNNMKIVEFCDVDLDDIKEILKDKEMKYELIIV